MTDYYLTILLMFCVVPSNLGVQILNCPQSQIKFEKLIGIRPNSQQRSTLLHSNRNHLPITLECLTRCANSNNCTSFLLFYNSSICFSFSDATTKTQNYDYDSHPDTNVVWFRKTCLKVADACRTKVWAIEITAGATLVGHNTRKFELIMTRQQCINNCMAERTFLCKSIKFSVLSHNISDPNPRGFCVLSDTDRHLTPNAFRVSRYEDEYIENQCVNTTHSPEYCAYEEYDNTTLEHTDLQLSNFTQQQCQEMCDVSIAFNCRGYSLVPLNNLVHNSNLQKFTCLLHSEDSKLIGPKLLVHNQGARYYERARCLNGRKMQVLVRLWKIAERGKAEFGNHRSTRAYSSVYHTFDFTVSCTSNMMSINYRPEQAFSGRIYTSGYSDTTPCYSDGHYTAIVQLNIPLNHSVCGIAEARTAEPWNRTLKSALLVIQYNPLIVTQADRLIKVGCVYGNNNNDDSEITLDTSVNFTNSFPNRGSTVVNNSTVLPSVSMRIVDYNTKQPTTDTEIGQELQMIIQITPGDGPYDIWASNLVATSGNNTLQLLDDNGCPTSLNIFSPFTKIQTNSSRLLITNFQAFKFPSTPLVRFSVMVHFCTLTCPPMRCINIEENRVKRSTDFLPKEQLTNSEVNATVYNINGRKNPNNTEEMIEEMPLDILLFVRGVNIAGDQLQLVYGENNRILVAGYDIINNEVCIDYSLFIGLLVTWVLLQIIIVVCCFLLIRKYKKYFHIEYTRQMDDMHQNFGFGHRDFGRRVHWADQ